MFYLFFMCVQPYAASKAVDPVKYVARKMFWRQNRIWRRLSFYVARCDSGVLALLAGLAPDAPAQKHFPDVSGFHSLILR
jgi:hypothetical protein